MIHLYHLALRDDWAQAQRVGSYEISTLGRTLAQVGFIHLSFAHQVKGSADRFYSGRSDVILLEFDAAALISPIRLEKVGEHRFPHLHGPFTPAEVAATTPYRPGPDGRFPSVG
jgi:glutathione S-transferase